MRDSLLRVHLRMDKPPAVTKLSLSNVPAQMRQPAVNQGKSPLSWPKPNLGLYEVKANLMLTAGGSWLTEISLIL